MQINLFTFYINKSINETYLIAIKSIKFLANLCHDVNSTKSLHCLLFLQITLLKCAKYCENWALCYVKFFFFKKLFNFIFMPIIIFLTLRKATKTPNIEQL